MEIYKTNLGINEKTEQELHDIALYHQGLVGSIGYGYALKGQGEGSIVGNGHYKCKWINSQGMGNHGSMVLIPCSSKARRLIQRSWTIRFLEEFPSLTELEADKMAHAISSVPYGRERRVYELVAEAIIVPKARDLWWWAISTPESVLLEEFGVRSFSQWYCRAFNRDSRPSQWRLYSVKEILKRYWNV